MVVIRGCDKVAEPFICAPGSEDLHEGENTQIDGQDDGVGCECCTKDIYIY